MPKKVPPSSAFGRRLTDLRLSRGLTQVQLAEKIGSSQRAISAYETVAEFPPTVVVIALAKALDVSADELLGLKKPSKARETRPAEGARLSRLLQSVMSLPEKDRRAVARLVSSLVAAQRGRKHDAAA